MKCLRYNTETKFLKEYRFDSQEANRGLFKSIFDVEEHLMFEIYVCPECRHTEFIYTGKSTWVDL
jgi:predicted nucleic-acid-binding Zn-ribbon protein